MSKSFSNLPQIFPNAYKWLCKSRKNHPPDSDIWNFKRTWHSQAEVIMESFKFGTYHFLMAASSTVMPKPVSVGTGAFLLNQSQ